MYNTDLPNRAELPSSRQLVKSTVVAAVTAFVLLLAVVMPAEYGLDPLGTGRMLGLKQMGEIKTSLAQEAEQEQSAGKPTTPAVIGTESSPPGVVQAAPAAPQPPKAAGGASARDQMSVTLKPGEAAEVKMTMVKDAEVNFSWTVQGGAVNFDNHGDPTVRKAGFYHGYGKGRQVQQDSGVIKAAFDGTHGFFWRNRGDAPVTIQLKTDGAYWGLLVFSAISDGTQS